MVVNVSIALKCLSNFVPVDWTRSRSAGRASTGLEVEGEDELDARGHLERELLRFSRGVKIGVRGVARGSSLVKVDEAWALPLAFLSAVVKVGVVMDFGFHFLFVS